MHTDTDTATATPDTVLHVPAFHLDAFRDRLAKFARWCDRERLPSPRVTETPGVVAWHLLDASDDYRRIRTTTDARTADAHRDLHGTAAVVPVDGATFTIAADLLALPGGWRLAAVVTPTDGGCVTTHAPGAPAVPADVVGDGTRCDHCEAARRRVETFVLHSPSEGWRMVGRNCVKAYLGVDPARWASYLSGFDALNTFAARESSGGDDDDRIGEPNGSTFRRVSYTVGEILAAAAFVVRERGRYIKANTDAPSTRGESMELLNPWDTLRALAKDARHGDARAARDLARFRERLAAFDALATPDALAARRWAALNTDPSSIALDMRSIARAGFVPDRSIGLACYMAAAYLTAAGEIGERRDVPARVDAHIGTTGERVDLAGCIALHVSTHDTQFGTSTLLVARDGTGRRFKVWYSGSGECPHRGETFNVRGTVKAHDTDARDGTRVTVLTRCKFSDIDATAQSSQNSAPAA